MCQELYIDDAEIHQTDKSCWCPLTDEQSLYHKESLQELGRLVMEKLRGRQTANPDQAVIDVRVSLRRW